MDSSVISKERLLLKRATLLLRRAFGRLPMGVRMQTKRLFKMNNVVKIGAIDLEVSDQHIYLNASLPGTYDYVPWNLIGELARQLRQSDVTLIDIGANVGDSAAHFRRHSSAPIVCIEPSDLFFEILQRNAKNLGDVTLVKKLFVPSNLIGRVSFSSGAQTGATYSVKNAENGWAGENISFSELLTDPDKQYIVKSDTDGFDSQIIRSLIGFLDQLDIPIIFFEGPTEEQLREGNLDEWITLLSKIQCRDYHIVLLTNFGLPYVYAGTNHDSLRSAFTSMTMSLQIGRALFHYFDILAVSKSHVTDMVRLKEPWPSQILGR